jgi:hypothetical protein
MSEASTAAPAASAGSPTPAVGPLGAMGKSTEILQTNGTWMCACVCDADDALGAEYKALRPGHPAWDELHAPYLIAARVSSFRVCAQT